MSKEFSMKPPANRNAKLFKMMESVQNNPPEELNE